jgi:hypothetical protein
MSSYKDTTTAAADGSEDDINERATRQIVHPLLIYDPRALDYIELIPLEYFESDNTTVRLHTSSNSTKYSIDIHTKKTYRLQYPEIKIFPKERKRNSRESVFWSQRLTRGSFNLIQILKESNSISSNMCLHHNSENDIHTRRSYSLMIGTLVLSGLEKPKPKKYDSEKR